MWYLLKSPSNLNSHYQLNTSKPIQLNKLVLKFCKETNENNIKKFKNVRLDIIYTTDPKTY